MLPPRCLDPPPLRRPAAVVWYRRHVLDRGNLEARGLQRPDRRLPPAARPPHPHLDPLHALPQRLAGAGLGRHLGGERRALARALEADLAGAGPCDHVAVEIADRDDRVVEARLHVSNAVRAHLAVALRRLLVLRHSLPPSGPRGPFARPSPARRFSRPVASAPAWPPRPASSSRPPSSSGPCASVHSCACAAHAPEALAGAAGRGRRRCPSGASRSSPSRCAARPPPCTRAR